MVKKRVLNNIILLVLVLMTGACVWGAFLGSEHAGRIAGGSFVAFFGLALLLLFLFSFVRYRFLLERPGLLMIHAGCVAILAGGLWGGAYSHDRRLENVTIGDKSLRYGKIYKSVVQIARRDYIDSLHQTDSHNRQLLARLGFKVFLSDFSIEQYPDGQIKDYISEIMVIADSGQHFGPYEVEVNKPLYFGGYHFYQHDFDHERGEFTVLTVVSDDGLWLVYAGYFMLLSGVFWHLWLERFWSWRAKGGVLV